jgi:hypothetical protein
MPSLFSKSTKIAHKLITVNKAIIQLTASLLPWRIPRKRPAFGEWLYDTPNDQ